MPNMAFELKKVIYSAFRQMLGGIVRLALRNGVSFLEFSELSKSLYVDIAAQEYGIRGRPTNDSRIALITGLNRREIKRIREASADKADQPPQETTGTMSKILTAWHQDPVYIDENKQPMELSLDGDSPNLTELVQTYGADMAAVTVLREFKRSQVVEEIETGIFRVLKRYYIPNYYSDEKQTPDFISPDAIRFGSSMLVDHINTIFFNLYRDDTDRPKRMELRAINPKIKKHMVPAFYNYADDLSIDYLTKIDNWLSEHEADDSDAYERVGIGLYYIEGQDKTVDLLNERNEGKE